MTATAESLPAVNGSLEIFSPSSIPVPLQHQHLPELCPAPGLQGITCWRLGWTNPRDGWALPTPLCHLPPPEVTFSRAPSCSHPSQPRSQLHRPGKALLELPSPRCVLVTLFYGFPPRAQPLFKPPGKTLKSLSLKTKAPGAALTGTGNGELITHPEHSLGCSHSAQAHPQPQPVDPARSSS